MRKIIVTIDGYSSCGKSTLARHLAERLGFLYIDSGAMYRAITLYFLRNHIDWQVADEVEEALRNIQIEFLHNEATGKNEIYLNGENVEYLIRDMLVAENVSQVSSNKAVRNFALAAQREIGRNKGIVMDGRDIGTTVFPNAEVKIFLTAEFAVRVGRRFKELVARNPNITLEEVEHNLEMRDYIDSNREHSPLRQAADAVELDNSQLTPQETLERALNMVHSLSNAR